MPVADLQVSVKAILSKGVRLQVEAFSLPLVLDFPFQGVGPQLKTRRNILCKIFPEIFELGVFKH